MLNNTTKAEDKARHFLECIISITNNMYLDSLKMARLLDNHVKQETADKLEIMYRELEDIDDCLYDVCTDCWC